MVELLSDHREQQSISCSPKTQIAMEDESREGIVTSSLRGGSVRFTYLWYPSCVESKQVFILLIILIFQIDPRGLGKSFI
ncbi:hypothetical protein RchiOBHm_Chr4g0396951 [Rosa chinensis]|uniref:Uncharacterized protein n=1 Tax=Rosa chinensis TaxID=74649 RepID=A0A2P6QRX8_ROSCH|nr:hypothetical protein RchiOBHm_Chr4g0396951 [Rosa chinensis]